jgi:Ran GTPase-activating protein (RanGAP) involved in mRNA processing and transport
LWFRNLEYLDLTGTRLSVRTARILAKSLASALAVNLVHLSVSENVEMGDKGCSAIASALHKCPNLTQLDASCCSLDIQTVAALSSYFSSAACKIKSLDLSYNYPEHDGTVAMVLASIPKSIENLVLARTLVGRRDIAALCARLSSGELCHLVALNVQDNLIHPDEMLTVARSVGKTSCARLRTLRL